MVTSVAPSAGLRVVSYGGGVQSTALLVLAAQGRVDFRVFLMANTGDDSEHPATLRYVREVAAPFAAAHDLELHLLDRTRRDGSVETLWGRLTKPGSRSLPIPVRMSNGAPGTRSCTADFKIKVTGRWLRQHGAHAGRACSNHTRFGPCPQHQPSTSVRGCRRHPVEGCDGCVPASRATVAIGISVDEIHRANNRRVEDHEDVVYPLLDLRLRRDDCMRIIRDAGLPVPPKSACFFCPFRSPAAWLDQATDEPDLFARSCELEDLLNRRRAALGRDPVYLTRFGAPLAQVIGTAQERLFDHDPGCDSGWCMT